VDESGRTTRNYQESKEILRNPEQPKKEVREIPLANVLQTKN
jgi:hypothetical protein